MEIILVAMCLFLTFRAPNFLTPDNLLAVLRSVSLQGLIAFGMTMVIIVGEIDLSVGAAAAFAGCLVAWLVQSHVPVALAIPLTVLSGVLCGAFMGAVRGLYAVPTFITSLALFTILKGAALMLTDGFPITSFPAWFAYLGSGYVMGIPFPAVVLIITFLATHTLMKRTAFGRAVYATGGNLETARLAGINVSAVRTSVMAITAGLAALSGIMLAARIMSGTPQAAQNWELDVIAAVIIGGTSLTGGVGSIWGTLVGVVFIGVIINGMTLLDVPVYAQHVVRGFLIFAAVLVNRVQIQKAGRLKG
jgi:sugar transport system permease protein